MNRSKGSSSTARLPVAPATYTPHATSGAPNAQPAATSAPIVEWPKPFTIGGAGRWLVATLRKEIHAKLKQLTLLGVLGAAYTGGKWVVDYRHAQQKAHDDRVIAMKQAVAAYEQTIRETVQRLFERLETAPKSVGLSDIDSLEVIATHHEEHAANIHKKLVTFVSVRAALGSGSLRCADAAAANDAPREVVRAVVAIGHIGRSAPGNTDLSRTNLRGASLDKLALRGAQFGSSCLRDASLAGADLTNADFTRAVLDSARLDGATLTHATFARASLVLATLDRVIARDTVSFENATLRSASLDEAQLQGTTMFVETDLTCARLSAAALGHVNWMAARVPAMRMEGTTIGAMKEWQTIRDAKALYLNGTTGLAVADSTWAVAKGARFQRMLETEIRDARSKAHCADP